MPYTLKGNTVVRADTGAVVKKHPTRAKALAHLRALKVNVEAQEAEWRWLDEHAEMWLEESAKTAALAVTPKPFGKPGGPGLWKHKGMMLPPYIQQVAHGILKTGKTESQAIQMAVGVMKNWASGRGKVSPEVKAAAAAALAQWEALKGTAHATTAAKKAASAVSESNEIEEAIGPIKKGAFHAWLGKPLSEPITDADIARGIAAGGHPARMAHFARSAKGWSHKAKKGAKKAAKAAT